MAKPPNPELSRRILELALEELADKAPEKVNMRSLARKAGVSPTAIYYYYESKDELFEQIKFAAMAELEGRLELSLGFALKAGESARSRLGLLVKTFVAWSLERPQVAKLLMEALPPQTELTEEKMRKYYAAFERARELVDEAVREGSLGSRDAILDSSVAQASLWGIVSQFTSKRVHPLYWDSIDPLVDRFMELFLGKQGGSS